MIGADLDNDGVEDLVLARSGVAVMLGNGDGTFADASSFLSREIPEASDKNDEASAVGPSASPFRFLLIGPPVQVYDSIRGSRFLV